MHNKSKKKKNSHKHQHNYQPPQPLEFRTEIKPITINQKKAFDAYHHNKHLMLHGTAGTGKSFISLYLALQDMYNSQTYTKVVIVRSVVQLREMGFLPGSQKEKMLAFEAPYHAICEELFNRRDAYEYLKSRQQVEFVSTSFIRGITFRNSIVVVDECQNLTAHEANSIITRIGENCRIIFCGDIRQTDLNRKKEMSGLDDFMKIIRKMDSFEFIEFMPSDICRSKMVKEYILIRNELEDNNIIEPLYY